MKKTQRIKASDFKKVAAKRNKKIRNATKCELDGIKFDSKLEMFCYSLLKQTKIKFDFKRIYTLQEAFRYQGQWVRAITSIPDFTILDDHGTKIAIVDTKGYANDTAPMKLKMLKFALKQSGLEIPIYLPSNRKEVDEVISKLC